ncbi:MAG: hypothetical protein RIQ33_604, partial [Bacteroidota bacterium]|jgi:hypothetical protein
MNKKITAISSILTFLTVLIFSVKSNAQNINIPEYWIHADSLRVRAIHVGDSSLLIGTTTTPGTIAAGANIIYSNNNAAIAIGRTGATGCPSGTTSTRSSFPGLAIGTTTATYMLHLHNSTGTTICQPNAGSFLHITNTSTGQNSTDGLRVGIPNSSVIAEVNQQSPNELQFLTNNANRMTIRGSAGLTQGFVGMGTNFTTPQYRLDVDDNINVNSNTATSTTTNFINSGYRIGGNLVLALPNDNLGRKNTFVGRTGNTNTGTGQQNTIVGYGSGSNLVNGADRNTFLGVESGNGTTNSYNTMIGYRAGYSNTSGIASTLIGYQAGYNNAINHSTFIGANAGFANTSGLQNTFIGTEAGATNTTNGDNTFTGFRCGTSNNGGEQNTFYGSLAGFNNTTGDNNTFLGKDAGSTNTSGSNNCYIGNHSGAPSAPPSPASTGSQNNFLGSSAGAHEITGDDNQQIGYMAGQSNSSGYRNVLIGTKSGAAIISNNDNIFIGHQSGQAFTGGNNNLLIGSNTSAANNISNAAAIGVNAQVRNSNQMILGDNGTNVGINLSNNFSGPQNSLEINSFPLTNTAITANANGGTGFSGLTLSDLSTASTPITNPGSGVLSVDGNGEVIYVNGGGTGGGFGQPCGSGGN